MPSVECPVCRSPYDDQRYPVVIPCGHSFCIICTAGYPHRQGKCPVCREFFHVRSQFQKNYAMIETIQILNKRNHVDNSSNATTPVDYPATVRLLRNKVNGKIRPSVSTLFGKSEQSAASKSLQALYQAISGEWLLMSGNRNGDDFDTSSCKSQMKFEKTDKGLHKIFLKSNGEEDWPKEVFTDDINLTIADEEMSIHFVKLLDENSFMAGLDKWTLDGALLTQKRGEVEWIYQRRTIASEKDTDTSKNETSLLQLIYEKFFKKTIPIKEIAPTPEEPVESTPSAQDLEPAVVPASHHPRTFDHINWTDNDSSAPFLSFIGTWKLLLSANKDEETDFSRCCKNVNFSIHPDGLEMFFGTPENPLTHIILYTLKDAEEVRILNDYRALEVTRVEFRETNRFSSICDNLSDSETWSVKEGILIQNRGALSWVYTLEI